MTLLKLLSRRSLWIALPAGLATTLAAAQHLVAQTPAQSAEAVQASFATTARPFLEKNCMGCHKGDTATAGLRVDQLTGAMEEQQMETWERVYRRVSKATMPPAAAHQPSAAERAQMVAWMDQAFAFARTRPTPKNGLVRRLTVAQYRNTLRQLLMLDDDVAEALPPDAVSKEGFVNNQERLELSPSQTEAYFEIADRALSRVIADPKQKPTIENFRLDFGAGINKDPVSDRLILGPNSFLLEPENFTVTQLTPTKPFAFKPFAMQTKLRFVEGYLGNASVRGWREYNSIYHAVFADFRGSNGYPKGKAWDSVPQGLLLRPAIPSENANGSEGFGPKANFKIAVRELPADGRFRVTVTAAKYDDGLLLDPGSVSPVQNASSVTVTDKSPIAHIAKAGVYQVDVYPPDAAPAPSADSSRLAEGLVGNWNLDGPGPGWKLRGEAVAVATPFGTGVHFGSELDAVVVPYDDNLNVGIGDFTVSGWVKVGGGRTAGIISARRENGPGWAVEVNTSGAVQLLTYGPEGKSNGRVVSDNHALLGIWQHLTVAVGRGPGHARIYVDGVLVGRGTIGSADLGAKNDVLIGASPGQESYVGDLDEFRMYRRALQPAEIRALAAPPAELPKSPAPGPAAPPAPEVHLAIGDRQFVGGLQQPAFLAVRLKSGDMPVSAGIGTVHRAAKIVLTPLASSDPVYRRFVAFEKRAPRIGLYLGFRRDCGETMMQVGTAQDVAGTKLRRYVFEGAMRNFPNPDVDASDGNYISGIRQIGVRSEYSDSRDMPRLLIRSVAFEGPYYDQWPTPAYRNLFGTATGGDAKAREIIRRFATRAFRRPVTADEERSLYGVYRTSAASGRGFRDSVKDALTVTLTMPQFLFLVEKSATPSPEPLEGYELASKLSYFLWNGPPDKRLLQLASAGTLRGQLDGEVRRMTADPKFTGFLRDFVPQWLNLDKFQVVEPDHRQFPDLTHVMRGNLMQEPVEYVRYLITNNLPVRNLVASDFIVANEPVASYYGLEGMVNSGFQFVAIKPKRHDLGGILTEAAILSGLSDGRESNPVRRGAWLARKIVAEPPPNPPPNVPPLQDDGKGLTLRQRIELHRSAPACASCHIRIDPWGIAFEQYDAGGRLKKTVVEAHSTLPDGSKVADVNGLKEYLAGTRADQVAFSVLKHLTTYAAGRSLSYAELDQLRHGSQKLKEGGYRMQDMIRYVATSPMFLEK